MRIGLMEMVAYRLKPIMTLSGYPVILLANYFIFSAIFKSSPEIAGYSVNEAVTYMSVAWFLRSLLKTDIDRLIGYRVRSGDIALDLIRPVYYPSLVFWQGLGRTIGRGVFVAAPLIVFGVLVLPLTRPNGLQDWLFFALALSIGYMMAFCINLLVGIFSFFIEYNLGLSWTVDMTVRLLAGLLIPLDFFPKGFATVLMFMPFRYIYFVPIQIYLGRIPISQMASTFGVGLTWVAAMFLITHITYATGVRRLGIQGG